MVNLGPFRMAVVSLLLTGSFAGAAEMPKNLINNATVTAGSMATKADGKYGIQRLHDGDPKTHWASRKQYRLPQWIKAEWKRPVKLDTVVIDIFWKELPGIYAAWKEVEVRLSDGAAAKRRFEKNASVFAAIRFDSPHTISWAEVRVRCVYERKTYLGINELGFYLDPRKHIAPPDPWRERMEPGHMKCPKQIPAKWLAPKAHPRLFCTPEELVEARKIVKETAWGKRYIARQRRLCSRFLRMTPEQLQALVPPPKSKFVYGLAMNLDPVRGQRTIWAGWDNPFAVKDRKGKVYPNEEWPDKGDGVVDPKTGNRYHFVARANAFIIYQLERNVLPALADVYALTGSQEHARTAAILFDAVAALYPTNRRGPLDYPTSSGDYDRGGRLDRPYYQTARGLMNYVTAIDLLAPSGEFDRPSLATKEKTIRENVIRNLLWDGGFYCLDWTCRGYQLHNGHADYMRGAAMVGIMLGKRDFAEPMLDGPLSMKAMLDINIDRNGFYHELSASYANHARDLYITIAELIEAARGLGWKNVASAYAHPAMRLFLTGPFNRQEIGGKIPTIGDAGPDRSVNDPMRRRPVGKYVGPDRFLKSQIKSAWIRLVRGPDAADRKQAARLLRDSFGSSATPEPPQDRWAIYHVSLDMLKTLETEKPDPSRFETKSVFYGAKGFALLRGGKSSKRYGAQLFFGPVHNHGQKEALTWQFFACGAEWSFDPGYYNTHYRFGWTTTTVSHQAMVVNMKSYDVGRGGGYLPAWHATPEVQWAMARHPAAYDDQGVTRYERLIAQVHNPATGELGYWLDVGRVVGGKVRDDSFHTQMKTISLNVQLPKPDPARPSLYGKKNFGRMLGRNGRLLGPEFDDKPFYWAPKGEGYGFLGNPRETAMPGSVRVILTSPSFAKQFSGAVVADLMGADGRKLIVAEGPQHIGTPSMPYLIRRDTGERASIFAKVIRLVDDPEADHIKGVEAVPVVSERNRKGGLFESAWCVTWSDGRRDLWFVGDHENPMLCSLEAQGFPAVQTDAQVALVRFNKDSRAVSIRASAATIVKVKGGPNLKGMGQIEGHIAKVHVNRSPATFTVSWNKGGEYLSRAKPGALLLTVPGTGQPSTWRIAEVAQNQVRFADVKPTMALTEFVSVKGKPGWYAMRSGVSRFFSAGGRAMKDYALGKAVYRNGRLVARIAELATDARSVKLVANGRPARLGKRFTGSILEVGDGDKVIVPMNLIWNAKK